MEHKEEYLKIIAILLQRNCAFGEHALSGPDQMVLMELLKTVGLEIPVYEKEI